MKPSKKKKPSSIQRRRPRVGLPVRISAIVSDDEADRIERAARKKGMSTSFYIVDIVLKAADHDLKESDAQDPHPGRTSSKK